MATNETIHGVRRVRHELRLRLLEVLRVSDLTPGMRRVTLGGAELAGFVSAAPGDHVKAFFPAPGEQRPVMPTLGEDARPVPPDGGRTPVRRDLTPRFDAERGELDLDFVLHGAGPASGWAASARPGALLGIAGPRGSKVVSPDFDWYLLGGDETALPALGRWLEGLPAGARAIVLAEVAGSEHELELPSRADVELRWLHRDGAAPGTTTLLADAACDLELPAGEGYAWFAGEAGSMRPLRRHLREDRGLDGDRLDVSGYWKRGVAEHDHHTPVEED